MEELPSNSKNPPPKGEKPKAPMILEAPAEVRKKTVGRKFRETFVRGDAKGVWLYVAGAVLAPAIRDMVADAGRQGLEKLIYGEPRSASRYSGKPSGNPKFNYNGISTGGRPVSPSAGRPATSANASRAFEDILVLDRGKAEMILEAMFERTEEYGVCTVADLYDMVGRSSEFTDMNRGWRDLSGSEIIRVHEGYIFKFPKVEGIPR